MEAFCPNCGIKITTIVGDKEKLLTCPGCKKTIKLSPPVDTEATTRPSVRAATPLMRKVVAARGVSLRPPSPVKLRRKVEAQGKPSLLLYGGIAAVVLIVIIAIIAAISTSQKRPEKRPLSPTQDTIATKTQPPEASQPAKEPARPKPGSQKKPTSKIAEDETAPATTTEEESPPPKKLTKIDRKFIEDHFLGKAPGFDEWKQGIKALQEAGMSVYKQLVNFIDDEEYYIARTAHQVLRELTNNPDMGKSIPEDIQERKRIKDQWLEWFKRAQE